MSISLQANNLTFDYSEKIKVFRAHNLEMNIPTTQKNKLYGIIGPSGTGKTTLLNILGGQLKPLGGEVIVNGTNIYEVGDDKRRQLLALQLQFPTSLRGTLKYNMLFGLPEKHGYSDEYLVKVLKRVGLWELFEPNEGLETLIGEGGLNLSGGQRQRLNFAGLYLRVKTYKPVLVLIDEPTSSLDEISEKAITEMILEIASMALTLVVAHRIETLYESTALLDSSLFESKDVLEFLTPAELKKESKYYRDLMAGKVELDS